MPTSKIIFWIIGIIVLVTIAYITVESFSQPGLSRFKGKMEELDFYRNENNTGPVIRVYAVRTKEQNPQILKEYGEAMPHTKYGKTIIYFFGVDFSKDVNLKEGPDHLGQELRPLVNFTFSKSPMGQSSLKDKFVK